MTSSNKYPNPRSGSPPSGSGSRINGGCKDFIALQMEFSRRAMKDRSVRKHLAELWRQELEIIAATVCRYLGTTDGAAG